MTVFQCGVVEKGEDGKEVRVVLRTYSSPVKARRAVKHWADLTLNTGKTFFVHEHEAHSVTEALAMARNVDELHGMLLEARLTYKGASPATKRKWAAATRRIELALNANAGRRALVRPQLLDAQGRPL